MGGPNITKNGKKPQTSKVFYYTSPSIGGMSDADEL